MGVTGIYINNHLHDFHLADVERVVEEAMKEHEAAGCRHADGTKERAMAKALTELRAVLGQFLEDEETFCPERGIGVKVAA